MFGRKKRASPERIRFDMVDGKPCFFSSLEYAFKNADGVRQYSQKQLNRIARVKFNVDEFRLEHPNRLLWDFRHEVSESSDRWVLYYFPDGTEYLSDLLEAMYS